MARKLGVHRRLVREALGERDAAIEETTGAEAASSRASGVFHRQVLVRTSALHGSSGIRRIVFARGLCSSCRAVRCRRRTCAGMCGSGSRNSGWRSARRMFRISYHWGVEAQVDLYEAWDDLDGERGKVNVFAMRSMASGAAFHRVFERATQQSFLEAA